MPNNDKCPPISPGTRVRTTKANWKLREKWMYKSWGEPKWGVNGVTVAYQGDHGLCYNVRHDDETDAWYDLTEIETIVAYERNVNLNTLQEETEKLLSLLQNREPGHFTWHVLLVERMQKVRSLISKMVP